jgi:hypothetical protein
MSAEVKKEWSYTSISFYAYHGVLLGDLYLYKKLYNDQRNAQVFSLFIYLLLPYMFRALF